MQDGCVLDSSLLDSVRQGHISTEVGWQQSTRYNIAAVGTHSLRWQYVKDGSGSSGDDCAWVDHVRWQAQTLYNQAQLQEALDTDLDVYTGGDSSWSMCDWPLYHIYYGDSSAHRARSPLPTLLTRRHHAPVHGAHAAATIPVVGAAVKPWRRRGWHR